MEFKNFNEFYNKAYNLAMQARHKQENSKQAIILARKIFNNSDLNSFYHIGFLDKKQINLLESKTSIIKFSVDSLIKNIIKHPEITLEEYLKITKLLTHPDKMCLSKSNNNSILLLKWDNKYYQVVIKTTLNKKENFLTSFRRLSQEEFNKY